MKKIILFIILHSFILCDETNSLPYTYKGGWPVNMNSDNIIDPGFDLPCPGNIGCECISSNDCINNNCQAHPKGNFCMPKKGDTMPRFEAIDQFGESVDLYDFSKVNYQNASHSVQVRCKIDDHGFWNALPRGLIYKPYRGCPKCGLERVG